MNRKRYLFFLSLLLLVPIFILAHDRNEGILREGTREGDQILSGAVVFRGEFLSPPYRVDLQQGELSINGIGFFPQAEDPTSLPPDIPVTDLAERKHELILRCERDYFSLVETAGKQEAMAEIRNLYEDDPLVSSLDFANDLLTITFADGKQIGLMLTAPPPQEHVARDLEQEKARLESMLREGWMISFSSGYTIFFPPEKANLLKGAVRDLLAGGLSEADAKTRIHEISGQQELADDICDRLTSWRAK